MSAGKAALPISVELHRARRIRWDTQPSSVPEPPWLDPRCREVVIIDIDKQEIVEVLYRREGVEPCPI